MKELALQKTRLDGRYDITELLGRGSYAEIFVARDTFAKPDSADQLVVVKALNVLLQEEPDADLERTLIENFQNEAVALDLVRHKNVINRLGHGTARDLNGTVFHYIVLEYLSGGDLAHISKHAPLSLEKTFFYLEQICHGLAHAHKSQVIHRDIKPNNLLLTKDLQTVKIADFGVAKFGDFDSPVTRVGTNIYAAPEHSPLNFAAEIADGKTFQLTPAADVYSLAKTVYALLAGESPRRFSNQPITSLPPRIANQGWANDVLRVLEKATQTDVSQRTKTVEQFFAELCQANALIDDQTCVAVRATVHRAAIGSLPASKIPARPEFNSLPNVQTVEPPLEQLPERPRVVIEINRPEIKPSATVSPNKFQNLNGGSAQNLTQSNQNSVAPPTPHKIAENAETPTKKPSIIAARAGSFAKRLALRLAVVLIILGAFAGILGGTYNYLQTEGYFAWTSWFNSDIGREAIVNATVVNNSPLANLRLEADPNSRDIGDVANGSTVKILNVKENWYEVEVIRRSVPKRQPNEPDRGWVNKKLVELQ